MPDFKTVICNVHFIALVFVPLLCMVGCNSKIELTPHEKPCETFIYNLSHDWEQFNQGCTAIGMSSFFDLAFDYAGCVDTSTNVSTALIFYDNDGSYLQTKTVIFPYGQFRIIGKKIKIAFCLRYGEETDLVKVVVQLVNSVNKSNKIEIVLPRPKGAV
ncbi:MAG: hypothetical protein NZ529_06290 [Cytophagaceae bacterium]|nr:hypothetical protein [Cytophagaceae bacterium]MDW8456388.1 hypothetical protein [Cytophagaceae bacterium]